MSHVAEKCQKSRIIVSCFLILMCEINKKCTLCFVFQLPEPKTKLNNNLSITPSNTSMGTPLNVLEVADPQLAVVVHLMTPLLPMSPPPVESPVIQPDRLQRSLAMQLIQHAANGKQSSHGILLSSMETSCKFVARMLFKI
jgi:hypothetical protein